MPCNAVAVTSVSVQVSLNSSELDLISKMCKAKFPGVQFSVANAPNGTFRVSCTNRTLVQEIACYAECVARELMQAKVADKVERLVQQVDRRYYTPQGALVMEVTL